jgi:hypothetical protein
MTDQTTPAPADTLRQRIAKAEAAVAAVVANATEWQKLAPTDDWGATPQDTTLADAGRFLLKLIELNAKHNPYLQITADRDRLAAALRELLGCLYPITRLGDPTPLYWQTGHPIPAAYVDRWRAVLEAAAPGYDGPSVAETKADDRRWWNGEKAGEQS